MRIQLTLITEYGTFYGEIFDVEEQEYQNIINYSKTFYNSGFEMVLENGDFVIFSPEIIKKSILKIEKVDVREEI